MSLKCDYGSLEEGIGSSLKRWDHSAPENAW